MKRLVAIAVLVLTSCVEELETVVLSQTDLPNILIVEATISNENKSQEVRLSRLDSLLDLELDTVFNPFVPPRNVERDLVNYEEGASVQILASDGNNYGFSETSPGSYRSNQEFGAQMNVEYQLQITTSDGRGYVSDAMKIEGEATIQNVYAEKMVTDSGEVGVGIFVDTQGVSGNAQNLRFTYDETYKIIAPNWSPLQFKLTDYDPCGLPETIYNLEIVERDTESRVCYKTEPSQEIIQNQEETIGSGGLDRFLVRFIGQDNYSIANRYSIEVQQLVSSAQSFGFYKQLDNFSRSENVFTQVQPGLLGGNITEMDGSQNGVIGFFDVVSVSKKRLFFNYEDFFPGEALPEYPVDCGLHSSPESHISYCADREGQFECPQSIIERLALGVISYVDVNGIDLGTCPGPYIYVALPCGDCTKLGSNIVPEFWTE